LYTVPASSSCVPAAAAAAAAAALPPHHHCSQIQPNLVGAAAIIQDDQHDFKLVELSRWALPTIPNAQYVIQPYQSTPPHRFNISLGRVTHRLRWSGSSDASQLQFDSFAADGALLQSWTGAGAACIRIGLHL
jgi:hypothetical protein